MCLNVSEFNFNNGIRPRKITVGPRLDLSKSGSAKNKPDNFAVNLFLHQIEK